MISPLQIMRFLKIERVMIKYGLEELVLSQSRYQWLSCIFWLSPTRWLNSENRSKPRGVRIRQALEELGPVFVKLGQILSTRRDLLAPDIGEELTRLQDNVPPFSNSEARQVIETALGDSVKELFHQLDDEPLAAASIAQVYGATLHDNRKVIVKVLRPGIAKVIDRDVSLMYLIARIVEFARGDAKRLRPTEVVAEYDTTIHDELDFLKEASNAVALRENFKTSDLLYIPEISWELTRSNVLVMERIHGIPIRDIPTMHALGMDMKKLATNAVEIFYTQVFTHNFFHADMHPGNIFVSGDRPENPTFIAVDFGIVGSLTEADQRYLGENMLAFFQRDYRKVAQLHIDSGWVPEYTRVSELEAAIRAVCDPIFEKPLAEISFGAVLVQLFQTAQRFEMEVQPQLVLLQKTLLNIEGLGRQLYPELDLWETAKPFLERWVLAQRGPKAVAEKIFKQLPYIAENLPELPVLLHKYLSLQVTEKEFEQRNAKLKQTQLSERAQSKSLLWTIVGSTLLLVAVLIGTAHYIVSNGQADIPVYIWVLGALASIILIRGLFS